MAGREPETLAARRVSVSGWLEVLGSSSEVDCFRASMRRSLFVEQADLVAKLRRMTAACLARGLDPPRFEEIGTHFRVTLSAVRRRAPATDKRDRTILKALAASSGGG